MMDCEHQKAGQCVRFDIRAPHYCALCQSLVHGEGVRRLWEQGLGPGKRIAAPLATKPVANGPGTQLTRLLHWFGIRPSRGCGCKQWAALMDLRGPDWCEANMDRVLGWLRKEAAKRGEEHAIRVPYTDTVARPLVKLAIYRARKAELPSEVYASPMALTQFVCFELGSQCNLGGIHDRCPNRHPERYLHLDTSRELDDDTIVETTERMYSEFHFTGFVAFHFYNEPLLQADRMFALIGRIKARVPQARFLLWTNGTLLPDDCSEFRVFQQAYVSRYPLKCARGVGCGLQSTFPAKIVALKQHVQKVSILDGNLDGRLDAIAETESNAPCARMHVEFVVDNYGNVHLCCHDWRGLASPGNVFHDDLATLVDRWEQIRDNVSGQRMSDDAPEVCRCCRMRTPNVHVFDRQIGHQIAAFRRLWKLGTGLRVAVVLCHYEIPDWRLAEHFDWNDRLYRQSEARVYVVTDKPYDVPDYAQCIVYPREDLPTIDGKSVFWIAGLKNAGLQRAIKDGAELVVCSDTDIAYTPEAWERMITVGPEEAIIPIYHKAKHYEDRYEDALVDPGCEGVIAMWTENWIACPWEEKCVGYGVEDRLQHDRIEDHLHRSVDRSIFVHHLDHCPQDGQDHGQSRPWNYSTLNPPNFIQNRRFLRKRRGLQSWQPKRKKP